MFSEPNMKPVNTANVILRKCFNAYERTREKEVIPIKAPTKNTNKTVISSVLTASIIKKYLPNSTKIKLPDIPGNIIAQMAIAPQRNIKNKLEGVSAGVATVI